MRAPASVLRTLAFGCFIYGSVFADDGPKLSDKPGSYSAPAPPWSLHEVWVPSDALDPVLARYPRAVSLGRDQLLTLLHDAHAADPAAVDPAALPPERAVLRQTRFEGRLVSSAQMQVSGELEVEVFSDGWAQVPLGLPGVTLGTAEIDDGRPANLRRLPGKGNRPAALLIQGRGLHRLRLGFVLPVAAGPESSAALPSVAGVGEFALHLPAGTRADGAGGCVVQPDGAGVVVRAALGATGKDPLRWHTPPPSSDAPAAILQGGTVDALVGEGAVTIRQEVTLRAALGKLPGETRFALPPGARAVRIEGTTTRWDLGADGLHVALDPAAGEAAFQVLYELPLALDPGGIPAKTDVPLLEAVGAHRVAGRIAVRQGPGVQVRRIDPGALATPTVGNGAPDAVADFALSDLPPAANAVTALSLEARRTRTRFSVDADAQASFPPGLVSITRQLAFHVEEGTLFSARVPLPKGETLTVLHSDPAADWRQEGDDLLLTWTAGIPETGQARVQLETQADFTPPTTGSPTPFRFRAVTVPGAERLTGYVAVSSTPALRVVTTGGDEPLERRDARVTPVTGDVAWFYRDGFDLALRVERRATETEARFTGYALPLAGAVEIHGQIDYRFLHAGVDAVRIRVPGNAADAFFFTGAHIAERRREGDVWTIRFQDEQTGTYALGVQATIPAPADPGDAERFHFRLPTVAPLDTARWSGAWAVEANTDTEIGFHAVGASEVDALHAPVLVGYQARRRVIGVFEFLGDGAAETAIDLDGVRHPAAGVAAAVVDSLALETFASTSGVARHRATLRARTAGDGFFNLRLPDGAALWLLTRDGALVKPVGGAAGELRVELPGGRDPAAASTVVVIYETPGQPWANSGRRTLAAPRFDPGVPVIESRWTLHVPDGFDYRIDGGVLTQASSPVNPGDLLLPQIGGALGHAAQWAFDHPRNLRMVTEADTGPVLGEPVQEMILSKDDQASTLPPNRPTPGPRFIDRVQQLKQLFSEAQGYYDTGRYDLAYKRYEQILAIDPYNDAARKDRERVDLARAKRRDAVSYDHTRGHLLAQADQGWDLPAARQTAEARRNLGAVRDEQDTASITRKLQNILIPNIEFRSTTVADAVEFLRQESRRLDPDPDPEARGVNIFLKLAGTGSASDTRITLTMSRLPLLEALKYVAQQAGLQVKVEQYAVSIVPITEMTDALISREFKVSPEFVGGPAATGGLGGGALDQTAVSALGGVAVARDVTGVGGVNIQRQDAKTFLEASGVTFPPGASATYLPSTGKLVVRNTRENLDLIEPLRQENSPVAPTTDALARGNGSGTYGIGANAADALLASGQPGRESEARVAGLLPIRLDLPANGITYSFEGGGEPGTLAFRYVDWRAAARWRWVWLTLGAAAFLLGAAGWAHPWRRTLGAMLALTFWPLVVAPSALTPCNALLAGWLWAVLGWTVTRFLLRRQRMAATVAVLCAAALLPAAAHAAPKTAPTPTPAPSPETVIVPYDATKPAGAQQPARYYLPYERFLELWDAAKRHRRPAAPEPPPGGERYTLNAARYDARLAGDTLEIDAALDFQTFGEGWVDVPLKLDGALTLDGAPASLAGGGVLSVGTPGPHHLAAALRLPAGTLAAGSEVSWPVPPTAATLVTFLLPRPDLRAEVRSNAPGGGGVIEDLVPGGRRYGAAAGGATAIRLTFRDAPPAAQANGQPALARIVSRLAVGARQETVRSEIRFPFPGRAQDHFTVYLDPGLTLTSLDAPGVRDWHLSTGGDRQTLDLALDPPARDAYALSLEADRPAPPDAARRRTFPTVSAQAGRIEQTAALLTDGALEITLPDGPPRGARRTEWTARPEDGGSRVFGAFESDGARGLVYGVDARRDKRAAHIDYLYQPGRGKIEWAASVRLRPDPGEAPIQTADLRLPAGATVQAVAGGAVRQWWRDGDVLSLRFGTGEVSFVVYLVQSLEPTPGTIALPALGASGFAEIDGEGIVAADCSFRVGLTLPAGARARDLSEIDPGQAAGEFQVKAPLERQRAFRYRHEFEVGATLELLPPLWEAQTVTRATVREGTVALETRVNVAVRQGVLDALKFSRWAGLPEARVNGTDVRETLALPEGKSRRDYQVLFQNPVYAGSEAAFTISQDLPLAAAGRAGLPDTVFPDGGGRDAGGFLLVENASEGEMTLDPRGLDPAIEKDVPFLPAQIVAGTRFFRVAPGVPWSLGVAVATLEKTAGRAALVAYAELTSTLRADGEEWHRAAYRLQNRRLQFLPVELPPGVEFIGARVAGESVRVDAGPGRTLLVPLLKTRPGELSYDVELVYRRPAPGTPDDPPRRTWGRWELDDPKLPGIPVEKTLWDVFLPTDTRLLGSGGNVEPVVAALNETEKLESALSDLRSLSATFQSASATRQEQQLALRNFNALAADVQEKARQGGVLRRGAAANASAALFKQPDARSQNFVVSHKQQLIQSELDTLSASNAAAQPAAPDHGSPANALSGMFSVSGQLQENWHDNRTLDQNRTRALDFEAQTASGSITNGKRKFALNDSVAVDLPATDQDFTGAVDGLGRSRLSTARATTAPVDAPASAALQPGSDTRRPISPESPTIPGLPAADAPDAVAGARTETLRSTGRISLAVDFPQTGQAYHFEKLKADAHLTLWSVRPAAFERLGWLLALAALIAAGGLARWMARGRLRFAR